jgi:hypothetical protein
VRNIRVLFLGTSWTAKCPKLYLLSLIHVQIVRHRRPGELIILLSFLERVGYFRKGIG